MHGRCPPLLERRLHMWVGAKCYAVVQQFLQKIRVDVAANFDEGWQIKRLGVFNEVFAKHILALLLTDNKARISKRMTKLCCIDAARLIGIKFVKRCRGRGNKLIVLPCQRCAVVVLRLHVLRPPHRDDHNTPVVRRNVMRLEVARTREPGARRICMQIAKGKGVACAEFMFVEVLKSRRGSPRSPWSSIIITEKLEAHRAHQHSTRRTRCISPGSQMLPRPLLFIHALLILGQKVHPTLQEHGSLRSRPSVRPPVHREKTHGNNSAPRVKIARSLVATQT